MSSLLLSFLLLYATRVVSAQFQLEPENVVVLQGSDASFNASLVGQWEIMTWIVQKNLVMTINFATGPTSSHRFSARNYSNGDMSRWEFTIHNVVRNDSGPVTCYIQGDYGEKTAQLSVQESGTVAILGGNLTVVPKGQQTEFQCVTSEWFPQPNISWLMYGAKVNPNLFNTTSQDQGSHFNSTSILRVQAASDTTVECQASIQALSKPRSSFTFLLLKTTPTDWTVLIAVVTSIGGFVLLVLLILGVIFVWKRRENKKSRDRDDLRRARTQSTINTVDVDSRQGSVNLGYITDGHKPGATECELNGHGQTDHPNRDKMPDVVNISPTANYHTSTDITGIRKLRHATIV